MRSLRFSMAAMLSAVSFGLLGRGSMPVLGVDDGVYPGIPHGGKRLKQPKGTSPSGCKNMPRGYYEQEITDLRFMTPRQRLMFAMGRKIILGQFYGVKR